MSLRSAFALLLALSAFTFLAACGSSGPGITRGQCPPSGCFSNSNLNGTYVFAVSGTDRVSGAPFTMVGSFSANGQSQGGITGGTIDINDVAYTPVAGASINTNSVYGVGQDGRGTATIGVPANPINGDNITFDFALQDSFHGVITGFDENYTGSGTIDLVTSGATLSGSYAFGFSGAIVGSSGTASPFGAVGDFTLGTNGAASGLADFAAGAVPYTDLTLSGTVVAGPSTTPATTLTTSAPFGTQTFDVYVINSTHLKFIETDTGANLAGDAYAQTSTAIPTGTLPFTLAGAYGSNVASAAGGYMVTDGAGNITSASTFDYNNDGSTNPVPGTFTGTYTTAVANSGRYELTLVSFSDGTEYAAYPSSGGLFMLEIDAGGFMFGAAYAPQTSTTLASAQGYALNFSGYNGAEESEVDDIAEFTASASGTTCTADGTSISTDTLVGVADENSFVNGPVLGQALCGQYTAGSGGRYAINVATNNLLGYYDLTAYTVDGTIFPFIEMDSQQISSGVFILQNATATSQSLIRSHSAFVPRALPHASKAKSLKAFERKD